ncbi:MAG: hypothetical protein ACP5F8_03515 [Candidatus Aenigmatarchaeota archaeon]
MRKVVYLEDLYKKMLDYSIDSVITFMKEYFKSIQKKKDKDYALTLLGIATQLKDTNITSFTKTYTILATLYKEFLNLLPKDDYEKEKDIVLGFVSKYGLDLDLLEALKKKDYAMIQRILSNI